MRISSRGILECEGRGCRAQLQSRALRLTIGGWDSNDGEENEQTKQGLDRRTVRRQLFDRRNGISAGQCHRPSPSRQHGRAWAAGSPDKAVPLSDVVSARPQIRRSADRICRRTRRNRAETAVNRPFPTKMGAPCVNAQIENLCLKSGLNSMKPSCNSFTSTGAPAVSCLIKLSCQASPAAGSETITLRTSTSWIRSGVGQGSGVRSGSLMSRGILVRGGGWGSRSSLGGGLLCVAGNPVRRRNSAGGLALYGEGRVKTRARQIIAETRQDRLVDANFCGKVSPRNVVLGEVVSKLLHDSHIAQCARKRQAALFMWCNCPWQPSVALCAS